MLRKVEELFKPEIILSLNLGEIHMKRLLCLLLMGLVSAQNIAGTLPKEKEPFILTYYDIREDIRQQLPEGKIIVDFYINERGEVENPVIKDTFNIDLNEVVLDKLKEVSYYPATQNGEPIKVKYTLPIVFK
jgi:hypothetical protein|tara:strand:+ start:358 stop:753 length:396 start_codon:yes stop_codon:yes gene_type:complete